MHATDFINRYRLDPGRIDGQACIRTLMAEMQLGLRGEGTLPMIPSYLSPDTRPQPEIPCCILDAGGTNLRIATAAFDRNGQCILSDPIKVPMLAMGQELSFSRFYDTLADHVRSTGHPQRIGLCFSYNVAHQRNLDGILQSWCKEIRVPEAVGKPVGASLRQALGPQCRQVHVVNDSTAALLAAHHCQKDVTLGVILGTGINICYIEQCRRIPKVPRDLQAETMIISTEIGEFKGIPQTVFDADLIARSDEPDMAWAEKQCAGAYLGQLICSAWQSAAREGILPADFPAAASLAVISDYLTGNCREIPHIPAAKQIAGTMIRRAAKIAAILTAAVILFRPSQEKNCTLVIEGSQYYKLTGFGPAYTRELEALLQPHRISFTVTRQDNSCLIGAALSAFAQPM